MSIKNRLSLREWFSRRTSGRLIIANVIVLGIGVSLVTVIMRDGFASRQAAIEDFRQVAPRAVTQHNRPMLEALLLSFGQRVQAGALGVCFNDQVVMSLRDGGQYCGNRSRSNSILSLLRSTDLPGLSGYRVYFVVPVLPHVVEIFMVVLAAFLMIFLNILLMKQLSSILWRDLIEPLHGSTLDDVQIAEVHDLLLAKEKTASAEAIRKLSLQVAHDIRSPLSALNMLVAKSSGLHEDQKAMLAAISGRIGGIAEDLLRKRPRTDLSSIDIDDSISQLLKEKRLQIEESGIHLSHKKATEGAFAIGVSEDFKRVMSNLLDNSIEATSIDGRIEIITAMSEKHISVMVRDNGRGISQGILRELGHRPITTKQNGNGLGVSGAFEIARSWGGVLSFESIEGQGSVVTWNLVKA